jgi:hypothetical protein
MNRGVRGHRVVGVLALTVAAAGCGRSAKVLTCAESVATWCSQGHCAATWDEAQVDATFCADLATSEPRRADCGDTHALSVGQPDLNTTYYYSVTSGALVAVVVASGFDDVTMCSAGPAGGFALPVCGGAVSEPLPECTDGGADAQP